VPLSPRFGYADFFHAAAVSRAKSSKRRGGWPIIIESSLFVLFRPDDPRHRRLDRTPEQSALARETGEARRQRREAGLGGCDDPVASDEEIHVVR
jgi:hypothetical protein